MPGRDYNFISRLIHKIALQYPAVAEMSFDIENTLAKSKQIFPGNHVFISGLARSGTTTLMNYLYQTGQFRSLTYGDMPFVLMPDTWRKISGRRAAPAYERAHADGIIIGPDSPEAFEEVFWRVFCGKEYIFDNRLRIHGVYNTVSKKFNHYIGNILTGGGTEGETRYLSKNNNNILRIDYLQKAFPEAYIIVPFRDPLQQATSLLNQHKHFSEIHKNDRFALNYMNWLGHFEFGLNQKPFFLGDLVAFEEMLSYPKTNINFWLLAWKNYYQYMGKHNGGNTIFFNYEKFCADPRSALTRLYSKINVAGHIPGWKPFSAVCRFTEGTDEAILKECNLLYLEIANKADSQF